MVNQQSSDHYWNVYFEEKTLIDFNDPVSKYIPSFSNLNCMKIKKEKQNFEDGDDYA